MDEKSDLLHAAADLASSTNMARAWFRRRIDLGLEIEDLVDSPAQRGIPSDFDEPASRAPRFSFDWPDGTAPAVVTGEPVPVPTDALPAVDIVIIAWTVDEAKALADVLTPGVTAKSWHRYEHLFADYLPEIRPGAPASVARRLGSYLVTEVRGRRVLCFKSELHLNQDGRKINGHTTLPVAKLFHQIIDETGARLVITTGTAGGTFRSHNLGDVIITRGAAFRLAMEFGDEDFANASYLSSTRVRRGQLATAEAFMQTIAGNLDEPDFGAPADGYNLPQVGDGVVPGPKHTPRIRVDGDGDLPAGHPILSADWFLFGSTTNGLETQGVAVEMGDAVLGMVIAERAADGRSTPGWLVVRNLSNPPINGNLPSDPHNMQAFWSGWYYDTFGYWTSVNGALACWALVAAAQ